MKKSTSFIVILFTLIFTNCEKERNNDSLITISGTLDVKKENYLTSDTRVLITWATDEPSQYIFGEGIIDIINKTFKIVLEDSLPNAAYYAEDFGIGFIFTTDDNEIEQKFYHDGIDWETITGAAGGYCVIYKKKNIIALDSLNNWTAKFQSGYSVGKGIDLPGVFDEFEPYNNHSVILIIDDLNNIEFTNWS